MYTPRGSLVTALEIMKMTETVAELSYFRYKYDFVISETISFMLDPELEAVSKTILLSP